MADVEEDGLSKEEMFRENFAAKMERRAKDAREGKTKSYHCKNMEEVDALFDSWMNE